MKKGKLIVFEGISGTGKETQAKLLSEYLGTKHIKSRIVYHPSTELKEILSAWRAARHIDAMAEVYLLLADRHYHVTKIIEPALDRGEWVISLRSAVSALVYQGKTTDDRNFIMHEFSHVEPEPDVLFWFDLTPDAALARINSRHEKTGEPLGKFETIERLTSIRRAYQAVLREVPHATVDAARTIEQIHDAIRSALHVG